MSVIKGHDKHVFGRARPSASGQHPIHMQPERDTHFRPLPAPTGQPPFRLDLKSVIAAANYRDIVASKKLTFHLNGDMGGIMYAVPQELVAAGMEKDFDAKVLITSDVDEAVAFLRKRPAALERPPRPTAHCFIDNRADDKLPNLIGGMASSPPWAMISGSRPAALL